MTKARINAYAHGGLVAATKRHPAGVYIPAGAPTVHGTGSPAALVLMREPDFARTLAATGYNPRATAMPPRALDGIESVSVGVNPPKSVPFRFGKNRKDITFASAQLVGLVQTIHGKRVTWARSRNRIESTGGSAFLFFAYLAERCVAVVMATALVPLDEPAPRPAVRRSAGRRA